MILRPYNGLFQHYSRITKDKLAMESTHAALLALSACARETSARV